MFSLSKTMLDCFREFFSGCTWKISRCKMRCVLNLWKFSIVVCLGISTAIYFFIVVGYVTVFFCSIDYFDISVWIILQLRVIHQTANSFPRAVLFLVYFWNKISYAIFIFCRISTRLVKEETVVISREFNKSIPFICCL